MNKRKEFKKRCEERAKKQKFKLDGRDLNNIFDIFYMVDFGTLKLNGMEKWASKFLDRLEPIIIEKSKK